jgi:hypothetical protein
MIGRDSIPDRQIRISPSNNADQDSITRMQVYSFIHQIVSRSSIPRGQISQHVPDIGDQGSLPTQHDFSWPQQTSNVNLIPSEPVNSFSSEQGSVLRRQIPPFPQQISNQNSSSCLSQDTVPILQQFDSQGTIPEQSAYTSQYLL